MFSSYFEKFQTIKFAVWNTKRKYNKNKSKSTNQIKFHWYNFPQSCKIGQSGRLTWQTCHWVVLIVYFQCSATCYIFNLLFGMSSLFISTWHTLHLLPVQIRNSRARWEMQQMSKNGTIVMRRNCFSLSNDIVSTL